MKWLACLELCAAFATLGFGQAASDSEITAHARAAQDAQKAQDFATAVREYETLSQLLPDSAEVQSNLGIALYFHNETQRALASFKEAAKMNPRLATPHLFAGLAWQRLSNPDAAVPELEKAVALNDKDPLARLWLGYSYVDQARYEEAARQFQKAAELDPNSIDAWYALGETNLRLGKTATAKLLTVAPDGGRAWELAGEQFQMQNNRQRALALFEGALQRRPDLPELSKVVQELGGHPEVTTAKVSVATTGSEEDRLYQEAHDFEQRARESFERVIRLAPDSYRAHQILADTYVAQQRLEDAITEYRLVLQLKPELPNIHEAIGISLLKLARTRDALQEFQEELQRQPRSSAAHMNVAKALILLGKDEEGERLVMEAAALNRPPPEVYKQLGKISLRRHEYRLAITKLTQYVNAVTDDASAYYMLSQAYRAVGNPDGVRHALLLYRRTSSSAKERTNAQKALQEFTGNTDDNRNDF